MPISAIDSVYFGHMFASSRMSEIFSDQGRFEGWLMMEAGLARGQARVGMIPQKAADEITEAAKIENIDTDAIIAAYKKKGARIVPLLSLIHI